MRKLSVIVFTDIEGYTALMQANEPAAQVARDRLRDATRELVPKMDGEIIQFLGDGFINTFSSTLQAINCAISLQKSLRQPPIIPVRIGIHQGEVTFVDDSVFGNAVNIASRVESLASSGSVLISESVFIEIANIPTIKTRFFGRFHFKNVRNPMKIYAVEDSHLVLPKEAHALAKLAGSATAALPVFVDEFIGREVLLEELAHTIRSSQNKIVSILGAGGLGKTRLAVATASTLSSSYRDGIAFVPLDAIENETLLLPGIGMALGLKENAEFSWNYLITEYLQDQQLLLILDNFEHLLKGAPLIENLIRVCPLLTVLTTTRKSLELECEVEFPISTFALPPLHWQEDSIKNECLLLFEQKARRVQPKFCITRDNYHAVAKITHFLEGLPLAIELAAARIKLMSAAAIADRLKDLFQLLKASSKRTKRHQTIFETIRWSYDLLSAGEREAFSRLATFPAGFTFDAAEAVIHDQDVFELIEALVNHSLLYRKNAADSGLYGMLRVVREFGVQKLREANLVEETEAAIAHYYAKLVERLSTEKNKRALDYLFDDELNNVRKALDFLSEKQIEAAKKMVIHLWSYYLKRGYMREIHQYLEKLLGTDEKLNDDYASLLLASGNLCHNLGFFKKSRIQFSKALSYYVDTKNKPATVQTLNFLSWAEFRLGNFDKSNIHAENALQEGSRMRDSSATARSLNNLAWVLHFQGNFNGARNLQKQVLKIREGMQDESGIAFAETNIAWCQIELGDMEAAFANSDRSIRSFEILKNQQLSTFAKMVQACGHLETGDLGQAKSVLQSICIPDFTAIGDSWGLAMSLEKLGEVNYIERHALDLNTHISKALEIRQRAGDRWGIASCHFWLAQYYVLQEDLFEAQRNLQVAIQKFRDLDARFLLSKCYTLLASIQTTNGKLDHASRSFTKAMAMLGSENSYQMDKLRHSYRKVWELFNSDDGIKIS